MIKIFNECQILNGLNIFQDLHTHQFNLIKITFTMTKKYQDFSEILC